MLPGMPLQEGSSDEIVQANIKELIAAGHSQEEAVAIAMQRAGRLQGDAQERCDAVVLKEPIESAAGFLRIPARLTRVGVFSYVNSDGSVTKEFRPPDEVFSKDSLDSLRMVPVTRGHPIDGKGVYPARARAVARGSVGDKIDHDEQFVEATLGVFDADLIAAIKRGDEREVSCGYLRVFDPTPGVYQGETYDGVQRQIRYNHVAIVTKGRAGPDVALRMDADWDEAYINNLPDSAFLYVEPGDKDGEGKTVPRSKRHFPYKNSAGVVDLPHVRNALARIPQSDVSASIKEEAMAKARKALEAQQGDNMSVRVKVGEKEFDCSQELADALNAQTAATQRSDAAQALSSAVARADAAEAQVKQLRDDAARIPELVKARVALERTASAIVAIEKMDSLTDRQIKETVIAKSFPELTCDKRDDAYVDGLFAAASQQKSSASSAGLAAMKLAGQRVDSESPRDKMIREQANAWKKENK